MIRLLPAVIFTLLAPALAVALPQFSLLSGTRCSSCHVSPGGGGLRTETGWYAMHDVGVVPREAIPALYPESQDNQVFDGAVTFGTDMRLQITRSFADSAASRLYIPMQIALYGSYRPIKELVVEGGINLAAFRVQNGSQVRFAGQRAGLFSVILSLSRDLPSIRVGLFRPSVGVRYDDHTSFPYSYATPRTRMNFTGPDWGEWGSELTWEKYKWLTLQAGVFGSSGLSQVRLSNGLQSVPALSGNNPTFTGRAVTWHTFADNTFNFYAGASLLANNDYRSLSGFIGGGVTDNVYLMADVTQTTKPGVLTSTMGMAELGWRFVTPVIAYVRYEHGVSNQAELASESVLTSAVFGAQIFPMPFVELRPEYRLFDTFYDGVSTRWNLQLHLFY